MPWLQRAQGGSLAPLRLSVSASGAPPDEGSPVECDSAEGVSREEAASGLTAVEARVRGMAGVEERRYKRHDVLIR